MGGVMVMVAAGWGSTGAKRPRPARASAAAKSMASSTRSDAEMEPKIRAKLAKSKIGFTVPVQTPRGEEPRTERGSRGGEE